MSDNINEKLIEEQPEPVDIEGTKLILSQMKNCICRIIKDNGEKGTGFFATIPFSNNTNNLLNVLITNNHILDENDIENDKTINLIMYKEERAIEKKIKIDNSRKKITILNKDEGIDITIIEVKPNKDEINNFLEIDDKIIELQCIRKSIYVLHHKREKRVVSYGLMKDVLEGKKIRHYCNTEEGSSGSPILSLNNFKVIGVHYGYEKSSNIKFNYGTFIQYAIKEFKNKYDNKSTKTNEIIIKYKIGKEDKIRIFGDGFVKNNKDSFQMIIKDKNYNLDSFYKIKNEKENEILKIKLKQIKSVTNLSYMFSNCLALSELPDISNFDTNNINNMEFMFNECSNLSSLPDISKWNTNKVTNMKAMFQKCSSLTKLPDISKWDTNNVINMSYMFTICKSLLSFPDISKWNTNIVTDMSSMFNECSSLSSLPDISKWNNINKVTNISGMFQKCSSLAQLPDID